MRKFANILLSAVDHAQKAGQLPTEATRNTVMTTLIAYTLGYRLSIPTNVVRRPDEWFIMNCLGKIEELLGKINEHVVLDIDGTLRVVRAIWTVRYRLVHDPLSVQAQQAINAALASSEFELAPVVRGCMAQMQMNDILYKLLRCESELQEELPVASEV